MNPLILLGIGAAAIMVAGKKKPEKSERRYSGVPKAIPAKIVSKPQILDPVKPKLAKAPTPKSYKNIIDQRGPGMAKYCRKMKHLNSIEDVARCVAGDIFPVSGWPATNASEPWERDAWHRITNIARLEFGLKPKPKQVTAQLFKIG